MKEREDETEGLMERIHKLLAQAVDKEVEP